ncbi:chain length determinant protein EpsF [Rhodoferax sp.]|uniref:chain length determinant protein EpsF n=1 Tax=Rhodoferax sp. TaxID=50421 RepID=UPI00261CB6C5|nr:chain length determinant protein EpsF [Rhodoferax sp.]MDD5479763.1 chain length determinant protein EpsF [Rhodoferax sp.]
MTLQQFLLILRARYKIALLALLVTVTTAVVVSLLLPKQYTTGAAVVIDVKAPDMVSGMILQGMMAPGYMATQVDIINSDRVAKTVVKMLKMDQSAAIQQQWQDDTKGEGQLADWLANLLQKNLDVKPARESTVININYTAVDPDFATAVANAFAQAYIDVNLDLQVAPARQYATFFEEQTKEARAKLEKAQQALSDYQQTHGITSADERLDFETAKLNETSSQLTGIQGQTTDSQSKRLNAQSDTLAEVMQSPLINGLKADIARMESRLTESSVNLGKNHPQAQRYAAELSSLKAQLTSETEKIRRSIETSYQISLAREQQLKGALENQKKRVLKLNKQRDELNVLRRDIESAQRAFELVSQRASQTNIASQTNQTNVSVLNPAVRPTLPSKPRVFLNTLVAIFLGTLLGVGLALMLELKERKVRSAQDLRDALDLPVLGSIGRATHLLPGKKVAA